MAALLAILGAIIGNKLVMTIFAAVAGGIGLYVAAASTGRRRRRPNRPRQKSRPEKIASK
ncbi:hypothetical protein [Mesorhizobium sp. M0220]|uniref:hypothetical protein n=1 Tax=Mesorhizobium sp. M0220 TaxID=2956920 RepID=UPI00333CC9CB